MVDPSPWPLLTALALVSTAVGGVAFIHSLTAGGLFLSVSVILLVSCLSRWWRDVISEASISGAHTNPVKRGMRIGMLVLILTEVMFFVVFFWSFFNAWLNPSSIISDFSFVGKMKWPPENIKTVDPFGVPLLNTVILLLSGCTVTWSHHSVVYGDVKDALKKLGVTIALGVTFTILQVREYLELGFKFREEGSKAIYSSNFYMPTGFHGFHVIVGTLFLSICWVRLYRKSMTQNDHLGFEFAVWYWHFVDVVWLFLFVFIYCLGS